MKSFLNRSLLTLAALAIVAMLVPVSASALPWCDACDDTGDCLACCRCDGGTLRACLQACGYPAAPSDEVALFPVSTCDVQLTPAETPTAKAEAPAENTESAPVEQQVAD